MICLMKAWPSLQGIPFKSDALVKGTCFPMKSVLLFAAYMLAVRAQEAVPIRTMAICDLLRNPSQYNGKVIALTGLYSPGGHGLYLRGEGCDGVLVTKGYQWPSLVWIVSSEEEMRRRGRAIAPYMQALFQVAAISRRELLRKGSGAKIAKVTVTFVGLFETRDDLANAVFQRPDGTVVGAGFGQVPGAPGQFFVDSVKNVEVELLPDAK